MVHRRVLHDDGLGVNEPLNETAFGQGLVVRGRQYLLIDSPRESSAKHRVLSQELFLKPLATFSLTELSYENYSLNFRQFWSALIDDLPLNVHLLTFDQLSSNEYLVRIEHFFEQNEDENYSQSVIVDLQKIFQKLGTISNLVEMNLSGNFPLNQIERLVWKTTDGNLTEKSSRRSVKTVQIRLKPMEIRTFRVNLN